MRYERVNTSELITEIAERHGFYEPELKALIQDIFIPALLTHLRDGKQVAVQGLGVFYPKKSQKPTGEGEYMIVPKYRPSPVAKRFLNKKEEEE